MTLMEFFTATGSSLVAEEVIAGLAIVTDDVVGRGGGSGNNALLLPADLLSKGKHVYIKEQEIQDTILFP